MDASISRGFAAQLIDRTKPGEDLAKAFNSGLADRVYDQFYQSCYTKKSDTIARKMRRASGGHMRIRIPTWNRNRTTVVLDCVIAARNMPAYSYFSREKIRWREDSLLMCTIFCDRTNGDFNMYRMSGPSIGKHAIARLLQRGAATPETLRAITHSALSRAREAAALLREEDDIYELMLPFAGGVIAVQVHGARKAEEDGSPLPPSLSIRTYMTESMLSEENYRRTLDLEAFYLDNAYSNTDRYRALLLENRRFQGVHRDIPEGAKVTEPSRRSLEAALNSSTQCTEASVTF